MIGLLDNEAATATEPPGVVLSALEAPSLGVSALVAESTLIASLRHEITTLRRRTAAQEQRLDNATSAMASAASLHRELCTSVVPTLHGAAIDVFYRPAEDVGGDAYTIVRLDEHRVAIGMIDATGHGVAASILAAYGQQSMRSAFRRAARNVETMPSEIMASVNRDVCDANLPDCQFIAAIVAIYDEREHVLHLSRGGTPYPIRLRRMQTPTTLEQGGPLLGAIEDATFEDHSVVLESGETFVIHTDGLDQALAEPHQPPVADVASTPWLQSLQDRAPCDAFLDIDRSHRDTFDDVTVISLRLT